MGDIAYLRIKNQIEIELNSYDDELNKLATSTYPTSTCRNILEKLKSRINDYRELTVKIIEDFDPGNPQETNSKLITKIHNPLVSQEIKFIDWIRNAQTINVPWSFVPCIEDLARKIIPDKEVLVCSENEFNYSMRWSKSEENALYPYYILTLPRPHRINILWHCLIGHELFHPLCSEFISKHNSATLTDIRTKALQAYQEIHTDEYEHESDLFTNTERRTHIARLTETIHYAWIRAMEELLSDMACVRLFGPAAILAMTAFSACSPENEQPDPANDFYPSIKYRIEVAWNAIDSDELEKLFSKLADVETAKPFLEIMRRLEEQSGKSEGASSVSEHPYPKIAYDQVNQLLPEARQFVNEKIAEDIVWSQNKHIEQIPELLKRLEKGIPPSELVIIVDEMNEGKYETVPANLSSILIVGWIYEAYWQEKFIPEGDIMKYMTMCRLLLKACEDSRLME